MGVLVSVHMPTYNHENYIQEAIEGVLMQETDFDYELIIGEDCSDDRTREIVRKYEKEYPTIIKPIYHKRNMGILRNDQAIFNRCLGKYIAMLDGDDYWTDKYKLQKQVNILEQREDIMLVCHNVDNYYEEEKFFDRYVRNSTEGEFDLDDFLKYEVCDTVSVMFRRIILDSMPPIWNKLPYTDHFIKVQCLLKGRGYFMEDSMAVYRINQNSFVHGNQIRFLTTEINYFNSLESLLENKESFIDDKIARVRMTLAREYLRIGDNKNCYKQFNEIKKGKKNWHNLKHQCQFLFMLGKHKLTNE